MAGAILVYRRGDVPIVRKSNHISILKVQSVSDDFSGELLAHVNEWLNELGFTDARMKCSKDGSFEILAREPAKEKTSSVKPH